MAMREKFTTAGAQAPPLPSLLGQNVTRWRATRWRATRWRATPRWKGVGRWCRYTAWRLSLAAMPQRGRTSEKRCACGGDAVRHQPAQTGSAARWRTAPPLRGSSECAERGATARPCQLADERRLPRVRPAAGEALFGMCAADNRRDESNGRAAGQCSAEDPRRLARWAHCIDASQYTQQRWCGAALGLASEPNTGDNGVHASAGPLEGLRERMVPASLGAAEYHRVPKLFGSCRSALACPSEKPGRKARQKRQETVTAPMRCSSALRRE